MGNQSAKMPNPHMNKTNAKKKKRILPLIFLEEATEFGCQISLSKGHFPRCLLVTDSVVNSLKDCPISKSPPSLAASVFMFLLFVSFFVI